MSVRASIGLATVAGGVLTLLVSVGAAGSLATRDPALHVAVETAAALISLVAAQLMYGRFLQGFEARDLLLTAALATFALANFAFSLVPALTGGENGRFATWAPLGGQLLGSALMALAALSPDRRLHRPHADFRRLMGGCLGVVAALGVAAAVLGDALPRAIGPGVSPADVDLERITGNPTVLAAQLAVAALLALAAVGFARRAARTGDELARWLAIAATLGAFSRLNFSLFPSLYSPYVFVGDFLRLGFFVALFIGGALEVRRARDVLAESAVLEERHRIARDIHDGVTQDLVYILQQGRRLAAEPDAPTSLRHMVLAAGRALDEARHAIAALHGSGAESLSDALKITAAETAGREGGRVELDLDGAVEIAVPIAVQEVLLRVLREAVINSFRHGRARTVKITLREAPGPHLIVSDDGAGFDVAAAAESGRLGLRSMAARVEAVGGELEIDSAPGRGTRVEVRLP